MINKKTTLFTNLSLLLLVIMSGLAAACLYRLPSHSYHIDTKDDVPDKQELHKTTEKQSDSSRTKDIATATLQAGTLQDAPGDSPSAAADQDVASSVTFSDTDIHRLQTKSHPFAAEAGKILSGGLQAEDSVSRRKILNYCEHFRTAYTSKDIDFIRQVLSDKALIIVGHTVRTERNGHDFGGSQNLSLIHI